MSTPSPRLVAPAATLFRRALVLKCPMCGKRPSTVKRWFGHHERCRSCGIRWHREHGFELGPIALNVVVTFFVLGVSMIIGFVATAPDFPVVALTAGLVSGAIVVPLVAYPFTFMLWQAFDLATHQPTQSELDEARASLGS